MIKSLKLGLSVVIAIIGSVSLTSCDKIISIFREQGDDISEPCCTEYGAIDPEFNERNYCERYQSIFYRNICVSTIVEYDTARGRIGPDIRFDEDFKDAAETTCQVLRPKELTENENYCDPNEGPMGCRTYAACIHNVLKYADGKDHVKNYINAGLTRISEAVNENSAQDVENTKPVLTPTENYCYKYQNTIYKYVCNYTYKNPKDSTEYNEQYDKDLSYAAEISCKLFKPEELNKNEDFCKNIYDPTTRDCYIYAACVRDVKEHDNGKEYMQNVISDLMNPKPNPDNPETEPGDAENNEPEADDVNPESESAGGNKV